MKQSNKMQTTKIPVLTDEEVLELGKIMHLNKNDELLKKRFWNEVYKKRGMKKGAVIDGK